MTTPRPPKERPPARLALADGAVFTGRAFGAVGAGRVQTGEVVFNTAMVGYQEALTDPSYAGQILAMTAPLVGVYGANAEDMESARAQIAGFVVHELIDAPSNHRATESLDAWLAAQGKLGVSDLDTRALAKRLRIEGVMPGALSDSEEHTDAALVELARSAPSMVGQNLAAGVSAPDWGTWSKTLGGWRPRFMPREESPGGAPPLRVLALDCGVKWNILRHLADRGCAVTIAPFDVGADRVREAFAKGEYDGLFISNGPGDPAAVTETIETLRGVVGGAADETPPTFGICLGCQLLALAMGAATYKLPFGHRGVNHPVLDRTRGRIEITSQNHGFAVEQKSLDAIGARTTHIHLNDDAVAGFALEDRPVFAVQHHPEASPGPHDAGVMFDQFIELMRDHHAVRA